MKKQVFYVNFDLYDHYIMNQDDQIESNILKSINELNERSQWYEQKQQYRDYILSLQNILPCGACRANLKTNLKHLPLKMSVMKSRDTFSRYIYNLHEMVNKMLKKKSNLIK